MLDISPVYYSSLKCKHCRTGSSSPSGSSRCFRCQANYYEDKNKSTCIKCPDGTMAYPGYPSCVRKPACTQMYDVIPKYQRCINGKRLVKYEIRDNLICDQASITIPPDAEVQCASCNLGSFFDILAGKCLPCNNGLYNKNENAAQCQICSSGRYAPLGAYYNNIEEIPDAFETTCEKMNYIYADICSLHKGWIALNNAFTVSPHLPKGIELLLRTKVNITTSKGKLTFTYQMNRRPAPIESLKLSIDGELTSTIFLVKHIDLQETDREVTKEFLLLPGEHTIEWIFQAIEVNVNPLSISLIKFDGLSVGSADSCLKCPKVIVCLTHLIGSI